MVGTKVEAAGIIRHGAKLLHAVAAKKAELIEAYRGLIDVYVAARDDMVDDVIDPRETRPAIIRALERAEGKRVERP